MQQRRSRVAFLHPLWRTMNNKGLANECTNATWRATYSIYHYQANQPKNLYLMSHRLLSVNPLPAPVEESDEEEWAPEDQIGDCDDQEHLDPCHPLSLHPLDVSTNPIRWRQTSFLKIENNSIVKIIELLKYLSSNNNSIQCI